MIDWLGLVASAIWILGLGILLATLSYAYALSEGASIRRVLAQAPFRLATTSGGMLFALGTGLAVDTWFERVGWFVVIALVAWEGKTAIVELTHRVESG